jgi:hypothetical protein
MFELIDSSSIASGEFLSAPRGGGEMMLQLLREAAKTANKGWGPTVRLSFLIATVAASAMLLGQAVQYL